MSAKAFEQIAADAVVDALEWKTRARNAEAENRELRALLDSILRAIEVGEVHRLGIAGDWYAALAVIAKATGAA